MSAIRLSQALKVRGARRASSLLADVERSPQPQWCLEQAFGRLVEISGDEDSAALSAALDWVLAAQRLGEPALWIAVGASSYFPPDFAQSGVELTALPTALAPDSGAAARMADLALRSGGLGVLFMDLTETPWLPQAAQSRLAGLARQRNSALVVLTRKAVGAPSLGPLVAFRVAARRRRVGVDRFLWEVEAVKDKRGQLGWQAQGARRGVDGLR